LILRVYLVWNSLVGILSVTKSESISRLPSQSQHEGIYFVFPSLRSQKQHYDNRRDDLCQFSVNPLGEPANFFPPTSARVTKSSVSKCSPPEFHPKTAMLELTHNHKPSPFPTCRLRKWQHSAWRGFGHIASTVNGVEMLVWEIRKVRSRIQEETERRENEICLVYLGS